MNLSKKEMEVLDTILDGAEFWCTDCDGKPEETDCGECQTYLEWERTRGAIQQKLAHSTPPRGRPKRTLADEYYHARMKRYWAERRVEKLEAKLRAEKVGPKRTLKDVAGTPNSLDFVGKVGEKR